MGFGLRGALTNLLALSEFIMSLLTYQKVFVLWPNIGCSLTENFVNFSTPRPDGRRADAITFPLGRGEAERRLAVIDVGKLLYLAGTGRANPM